MESINENISITIALRPKAIIDCKDKLLPIILNHLQSIPVANFSEGPIDLTNIVISKLYVPVDQLNIQFNQGTITARSSGLKISVNLTIKAILPLGFKIIAETFANTNHSDLSITFSVIKENGVNRIKMHEVIVNVNDLYIQIAGALGTIASILTNSITPLLKDTINKKVAALLQDSMEVELNHLLDNINYHSEIPGAMLIADYHMVCSPTIETDFISFSFYAKFFNMNKPHLDHKLESLKTRPSLPKYDPESEEDVQFFISEYVIDSLLFSIYNAGFLSFKIDQSMIPIDSGYMLTTASMNTLFNGIEDIYGYDEPVRLSLKADDKEPSLRIKADVIQGEITGIVEVQVFNKNLWSTAISLNMTLSFEGAISINNYTVYGSVSDIQFISLKIIESKIPDVDEDLLNDIFNTILKLALGPFNDKFLAKGFILPSVPYTNLESIKVELYDSYMKIRGTPIIDEGIGKLLAEELKLYI